ncbi:sulfurtransferase [soil metagenome]
MSSFANPEVLVSTDWVAQNLTDTDNIRIVESNEDVLLYATGHIPNAVHIDWVTDLQDRVVRDYVGKSEFARLCSERGISNDTTLVFYGDKNNWWACYTFWVFKLFGHNNCRIMDGGRTKWEAEGRQKSKQTPQFGSTDYSPTDPNTSIRAFRDEVLKHSKKGGQLLDVRSPAEFIGEVTHMPGYPQEGAMRGGHIPGARNVPWARAAAEDGTFKPREELEEIYLNEQGLAANKDTIAYCRIGERSAHTWFVLRYLLGFDDVKNYDGSWTEWGNLVGAPIEKGEPEG